MILVLNLGLKSIRAIVFDRGGGKRRTAARNVETKLKGSWVEQSPEEWWKLALEVMSEVLRDAEVRDGLEAMTVTSSSCCLVCLGEDGQALRPAMMVSDRRAVQEAKELAQLEAFRLAQSSNQNLVSEPSLMLPKLMWLKQHEGEIWRTARWFASSNDYLLFRLCGSRITDPLNAEKFGYLVEEGAYPNALLRACEVAEERLPEVRPQGSVAGEWLPQVCRAVGLEGHAEVPVMLTTYDALCAFFGSGLSAVGEACDVSGTVTSLRVLSPRSIKDSSALPVYSQHETQTGVHIVGGSNNLGGGLIEWAKQCFYVNDPEPYGSMEREAAEVGAGADGLIFLPYLLGERMPLWDADARGLFFGIERKHQRQHFARAVLESTAFSLVPLREAIEAAAGKIQRFRVSGGLARVDLISRIKADVLEAEVEVIEEFETTSLGAFMLVSLALDHIRSLAEASQFVRIRARIEPHTKTSAFYRDIVDFYKALYEANRPLFARRAELARRGREAAPVAVENL